MADLAAHHDTAVGQLRAELDEQVQAAHQRAQAPETERARAEAWPESCGPTWSAAENNTPGCRPPSPQQIEQARAGLAETLGVRHRLELDATRASAEGQLARLQGELSGATARAEAAEHLALGLPAGGRAPRRPARPARCRPLPGPGTSETPASSRVNQRSPTSPGHRGTPA